MSEYLDTLTDEENLEEPKSEDPEQVETDIQEGEVFKLGEHRLMCGDATNEEHVETLMDGDKADIVFTDPPYGINVVEESGVLQGEGSSKNSSKIGASNKAEAKEYMPVAGDDSTDASRNHINLIRDYCEEMLIWGGNYFTDFLKPSRGWIIWNKKNGETSFADVEMAWTSYDISARMFDWQWSGMIREGSEELEGSERSHPTQKPVGLTAKIMNKYCPNQIKSVIDCFAGSGTTLLAAEQTNRKAYCMELDPQYCQVIINRWEELTGKKADPIN